MDSRQKYSVRYVYKCFYVLNTAAYLPDCMMLSICLSFICLPVYDIDYKLLPQKNRRLFRSPVLLFHFMYFFLFSFSAFSVSFLFSLFVLLYFLLQLLPPFHGLLFLPVYSNIPHLKVSPCNTHTV